MIIGIDPHKMSHTANAVDPATNTTAASLRINASLAGYRELMRWSKQFPERRWAVVNRRVFCIRSGRFKQRTHPPDATDSTAADVTIVRMRHHQPTRDHCERRIAEGRTKREIIRCVKRYIGCEIHQNLPPAVRLRSGPEIVTKAARQT